MATQSQKKKLGIVVIVALQDEFVTLFGHEKISRDTTIPKEVGTWYYWEIEGAEVAHVSFIGSMGPVEATKFTTKFLEHYQPRTLVNIGVSGSFNDDVVLGDVVVADLTDLYGDAGAIEDVNGVPTLRPTGKPIQTEDFKALVAHFPIENRTQYEEWQRSCAKHSSSFVGPALTLIPDQLKRVPCAVHCGPVACASEVVKSPTWKSEILRRNRKYLAVDMESAGIAYSAFESRKGGTEILIIRGISDAADERKKALDNIGKDNKGGIRNWALRNALDFLVLLLRAKAALKPQKSGPKRRAIPPLSSDALAQLRRTFRDEGILQRLEQEPELMLPKYEKLFSYFVAIGAESLKFEDILAKVESTNPGGRSMSFVAGRAGAGKSTFLLCLYVCQMLRFHRGETKLKPWFVHLRYYSENFSTEIAETVGMDQLGKDMNILFESVETSTDEGHFLIVDGSDEYYRHPRQSAVDQEFGKRLDELAGPKRIFKIVSFGEGERDQFGQTGFTPSEALRWAEKTELLRLQRRTLVGGTKEAAKAEARPVVEAFLGVTPYGNIADTAERIIDCILALQISELDLFTLSLLEMGVRRQWDLIEGGIGVLYYNYCAEKVRKLWGKSEQQEQNFKITLKSLAKLVYELYVQEGVDVDQELGALVSVNPQLAALGAAIPHVHPSVRDFLIAEHAVDRLLNRDDALDPDESAIYPYGTNRFVRAIISRSKPSEREVFAKIRLIIDKTALRQKTHLCYILGRFKDPSIRKDAQELLAIILDDIHSDPRFSEPSRIDGSPECRSLLLLQRTVEISLIYLEDKAASRRYLQTLLKWPICDNLNRGFHLQYYEDVPRPARSEELIAFDNVKLAPTKTFDILERKLRSDVASGVVRSMSPIELHTLCSICLNRHIQGTLNSDHRARMIELLEISNDGSLLGFPKEHVSYVDMAKFILQNETCSVGQIFCQLLALKEEPRVGWISERNLGDRVVKRECPKPESVAAHTWGCVLLAEVFLPEHIGPEKNYSKSEVIRTLAIHDLAECFTHDMAAFEKKKADHDKEDRVMRMILSLSTLTPFSNFHTSWARWEGLKRKGKNIAGINALVAADIDLIENYLQMRRYLGRDFHNIPDAQEWAEELRDALETDVCKDVWNMLRHEGASILSWIK